MKRTQSPKISRSIFWLLLIAIGMGSCFPFLTTSRKWRITWDDNLEIDKRNFLEFAKSLPSKENPNVILIVADDLGKYEVSAYGAKHIQTPHIDAIGSQGVTFTEGYVSAAVCSPSRASILTGRYQQRYGFDHVTAERYPRSTFSYFVGKHFVNTDDWVISTGPHYPAKRQIKKQGIPPFEITIADLLKARGYKTAITGKWHVGHSKEQVPNSMGFDYQYGFYGASTLYTPKRDTPGFVNHIQNLFSTRYQWKKGRKGSSIMTRNDKEIIENDYLTFAMKDEAINFMKQNKDNPFFLYLPFSAPHVPFQAPQKYYDKYAHIEDENKRVYYAMISALDDAIGEVTASVRDLGIEENTLIIFLSDNGGATYTKATDNGPLKGGKLTTFEGGINVPFMMKWKGHINPGTTYDEPVIAMDAFMTAATAANCPLPKDRVYDGVDLVPYVNGDIDQKPHEALFWMSNHVKAMRKGDWKFIMSDRDDWIHLYNLKEDKCEAYDVNDQHPEIFYEMMQDHKKWQKELPKNPLWPRIMDHRFTIDGKEYLFPV